MSTTPPENKLQSARQRISDMLHDPENPLAGIFEKAEKTLRLKREWLFFGFVVLIILYLIIGHGTGLLVNLIGFVYPAYKSCKAIDSEETDDDTQWLTYWVVYAFFGLIEFFTDILLSWIPFYFLGKCVFLIWCMMPMANNGSAVIYHNFIKPFIKRHEKTFEKAIDMTSKLAKEGAKDAFGALKDAAGNISVGDIQRLQEKTSQLHQQFGGGDDEEDKKEQ
ncbi:PREDICTED: receptor expression-enhancing protein 5-like [Amphimedon queenslandica]|uniref:Receptor expression-enhancing protein n=1 Tax=Amphimedon queenslandica TaxID=400682 RepID=A0A1X7VWP1_AMPQE|nr:PREDICTED: receptor expression-enhancing protein 5-like [Amphimedon queenslandica]|eukprot:XP_003382355.1 PREDICTED: receptor expression-enhancing protein 5-like [Amphimedon queenslandica]